MRYVRAVFHLFASFKAMEMLFCIGFPSWHLWTPCTANAWLLMLFTKLWRAPEFSLMIFFNIPTTNWSIGWAKNLWEISRSVTQQPHRRMTGPRGLLEAFPAFAVVRCFSASTRKGTSLEIPLTCLLVTASALAMSKAAWKEMVASFSRSLVCAHLELDPKMMLIWLCELTVFNKYSGFLSKRIDWLVGFCFKVLSLYLASRKLLFGERSLELFCVRFIYIWVSSSDKFAFCPVIKVVSFA